MDNRPNLLSSCLSSLKYFPDWTLVFVGQEFSNERKKEIENLSPIEAFYLWRDTKAGMHNAKLYGLELIREKSKKHVVVSIDDDMEFLPLTNFDRILNFCREKNVGLVSGNWVRSEKLLNKKKLIQKFKKQAIVYTAGGLAFSEKITDLIINLGENDYWCDNTEWSLASFLNGYDNFRYLGTLAIHRILSAGGRKSYVETQRQLPSPEYISIKHDKNGGFLIPTTKDLTSFTKFRNKVNKK